MALELVAVTVAQPSRILTGFPDIRLHGSADVLRRFKERHLFTLFFYFAKLNFQTWIFPDVTEPSDTHQPWWPPAFGVSPEMTIHRLWGAVAN